MEQSSSSKEKAISCQFDCFCKMVLHGEMVNYHKHMDYRRKHEISFEELSNREMSLLYTLDEYAMDRVCFEVMGYEVEVKDILIAEAIQALPQKKRDVILLSFFLEMSDAEIANLMNLVRSTIYHHRQSSLKSLRKVMEDMKHGER